MSAKKEINLKVHVVTYFKRDIELNHKFYIILEVSLAITLPSFWIYIGHPSFSLLDLFLSFSHTKMWTILIRISLALLFLSLVPLKSGKTNRTLFEFPVHTFKLILYL